MTPPDDFYDAETCPICGSTTCEEHLPSPPPQKKSGNGESVVRPFVKPGTPRGLNTKHLHEAGDVTTEGEDLATADISYTVDGMVPAYGMVGMLVARAKVGKSTFSQALAGAVAMGQDFLERPTVKTRVLYIAAEDPPEYTAWLARHLKVDRHRMTFYRAPLRLDTTGLRALTETIEDGVYGFVHISSWQAAIRGLIKDENDNAGAVAIVETIKAVARTTNIPWLIDAHAGKGEDQNDEADPTLALRGASSAAGAADYILSLRYADGPFGTRRRLSGKGRFVNIEPLTIDYDPNTGVYRCLGGVKDASVDITWRCITEMGALDETPRSLIEIARRAALAPEGVRISGALRRHLGRVLAGRPDVGREDKLVRGQKTTFYRLLNEPATVPQQ